LINGFPNMMNSLSKTTYCITRSSHEPRHADFSPLRWLCTTASTLRWRTTLR
jgi:hypothetical protein